MRVLLDENIDRRLRQAFDSDFEIITVTEQGWSGMKNSELLRPAQTEFDALVTMDKGIEHQQNPSRINLGIVLISARSNRRQDVEPAMPEMNRVLASTSPPSCTAMVCIS
jgi:predicted nuclease of predicted toxin-antitoxin system